MSRPARLGAFILATLAVLAAGIFIIGSKRYLFTHSYQLKTQFASVAGLDAGAEVRVGGVHSGTIRSIELPQTPGGMVTVEMDMDPGTHSIILKDSIATIETEGLLGNQYMAISFGTPGSPGVQSGDMIASTPPLAMADLLRKTDVILDSSHEALKNVTVATANMVSISGKIDKGQGTIGELVNDKKVYQEMGEATAAVRDTVI